MVKLLHHKKIHLHNLRFLFPAASFGLVFALSGCGGLSNPSVEIGLEAQRAYQIGDQKFTSDQLNYLLASFMTSIEEQNFASDQDDFWNEVYREESGQTRYEYLRDVILQEELNEISALYSIGLEAGISLTDSEEQQILESYSRSSTDPIHISGEDKEIYALEDSILSESEYVDLMTRYRTVEKYLDSVVSEEDLAVSEDRVRVISVRMLSSSDRTVLEGVLEKMQSGSTFEAAAASSGLTMTSQTMRRNESEAAVELAAFSLKTGETSEIVSCEDGSFCLIYCVSQYEQTLTEENRTQVLQQNRIDLWYPEAVEWIRNSDSYRSEKLWSELDPAYTLPSEQTFFEKYSSLFQN